MVNFVSIQFKLSIFIFFIFVFLPFVWLTYILLFFLMDSFNASVSKVFVATIWLIMSLIRKTFDLSIR